MDDEGHFLETKKDKLKTYKVENMYSEVSPERALALTINRLERSLKDPKTNVPPVYDREGNVLWPEYIPYEKVKEVLKEKDGGKNNGSEI